ncbi:hypothetical protein Syncc8109_1212 [Synechococcus sp. WH 8109]|uniref:hypothetical protein n=1 Tax=Synechococcus sp. WH 8109 TaxID=166314 RepID=UPI0003E016BD|nr:hypothetical protein [Synechococcus sp. WH 8109]AHF63582.1 hypothetical protein Syncc8109_1212 [Synechococcus sp. WH 8109]
MTPDRASIRSLVVGMIFVLAACSTMSDQERKAFLCEQWDQGTKNVDQLMATYSFATGKRLKGRSGGGRTGFGFIEGDLKQLAQEVDAACNVQTIGPE